MELKQTNKQLYEAWNKAKKKKINLPLVFFVLHIRRYGLPKKASACKHLSLSLSLGLYG